ncbi:MAG: cytochrome C biogenesis protein, partial [Thaumarchaeota archaeon]|nr:cytochrome C biogenesis protein [Nitrososphaerota archaeon]
MSLLWLRVALVLYSAAALAVLPAALYDRLGWARIAIPATVAAALFHFVSLAEMLNAAHHTLPVDSHETQSLLALLLVISFLSVYARWHTVALGIFVLPIA